VELLPAHQERVEVKEGSTAIRRKVARCAREQGKECRSGQGSAVELVTVAASSTTGNEGLELSSQDYASNRDQEGRR